MALVRVSTFNVNVDIVEELEHFEWRRAKWTHDKLIACSPFREDQSPSFFVNLEGEYAGTFGDSGAYDDEYNSGGLVKLLAFLRNETSEETSEYLLSKYVELSENTDQRLILPRLRINNVQATLSRSIIEVCVSPYLQSRKISEEVQRQANVGKSRQLGFVAIPWHSPDGKLCNVKYRATRGKTFYYEKNARPIRELVYGADLYTKSCDDLLVCEAEIDALSWRTVGINAIAVGGVMFTQQQADIIRRLPFRRLIIAGDHDKSGEKFNTRIVQAMSDRRLALLQWGAFDCKDANEVLCKYGGQALKELADGALDLPTLTCIL